MEVAATILTILLLLIFLGVTLLWKPSPCLKTLGGKHVLITGGSSGIGLAIAKEALSQGAFVTLIARSSAKLEKAIDKLVDNKTISADRISTKVYVYVFLIVSFIIGVRYLLG
uniref:Ketoreductase (KR) domain-containing protein n=1 Tax=Picea sitchensis TaxID=3332 RepID=B8LMB5_PICSI|nr:unknown [Picea sitchensis]